MATSDHDHGHSTSAHTATIYTHERADQIDTINIYTHLVSPIFDDS